MWNEMELMNAIGFNGLHLKARGREGLHRRPLHIYSMNMEWCKFLPHAWFARKMQNNPGFSWTCM
jgi:hypothetical protein